MVTLATVEQQLKTIGCNFRFWGRSELRELCEILLPGEKIAQAVNGQYEAGFAMLVATDFRVLLIDKKPKYLTLKDIRFDMITELDFSARLMNSTVRIYTPNKELRFTTPSPKRLRKLYTHTQHKVMEIRHHFMMQQFAHQEQMKQITPGMLMTPGYYNPMTGGAAYQALPQFSDTDQPVPLQNQSFYNPEPLPQPRMQGASERVAAAMGNAGLKSIVRNGQIIREYMSVPFAQRWRKRPYGFTRDPVHGHTQPQA